MSQLETGRPATTVSVMQSRWFVEGSKAMSSNVARDDCPYSANSPKAILWTAGWDWESGVIPPAAPERIAAPAKVAQPAPTGEFDDIMVEQ